ncbi:MAG: hypothetical protein AVDCRST_MAG89-3005 [uncultured Gemmatimonadetes bacterium]|uniref:Lipoprotein n=1 Tax=uncultured Gemmatimonadota bacterium TaxID=203437 RepID=A0A6J4M5I9_9BACT|nr:MAG: hypothetical protein AVDCRST_MAG89-3005 [uncultured Gemmatimonadota bacterium]
MHKTRRILALTIVSITLMGCRDGKSPIEPGPKGPAPGELRFEYSGAYTGTFSVMGDPRASRVAAAAVDYDGENELHIVGYRYPPQGFAYDDFGIVLPNPQVGTIDCATMAACPVTHAFVAFNATSPGSGYGDATSLRLTISTLRADSVKGSFEMQVRMRESGATLSVTRGGFSVPRFHF